LFGENEKSRPKVKKFRNESNARLGGGNASQEGNIKENFNRMEIGGAQKRSPESPLGTKKSTNVLCVKGGKGKQWGKPNGFKNVADPRPLNH